MTHSPVTPCFFVDLDQLPADFPTHRHGAEFWTALGRAVATFGYLEEILGKAIFCFTGTRRYADDEIEAAYQKWLPTLEKALSDQLGNLIRTYGEAVRSHDTANVTHLDDLLRHLRDAATIRNVLCHGSWRDPDSEGRSIPLFVTPKMDVFDTAIDKNFLEQVQRHVVELSCHVINSVTQMGWQFPGSGGPGSQLYKRES